MDSKCLWIRTVVLFLPAPDSGQLIIVKIDLDNNSSMLYIKGGIRLSFLLVDYHSL